MVHALHHPRHLSLLHTNARNLQTRHPTQPRQETRNRDSQTSYASRETEHVQETRAPDAYAIH